VQQHSSHQSANTIPAFMAMPVYHPPPSTISATVPFSTPISIAQTLLHRGSNISPGSSNIQSGVNSKHLTPRSRPLSASVQQAMMPKKANRRQSIETFRRQMDVRRLPWLTPQRCKRIIQAIRSRGRFLLKSRRMIDEGRKKYANTSFKNRIESLEAELDRLNGRLDNVKETTKYNFAALKEIFSIEFKQLVEEMHLLLFTVRTNGSGLSSFLKTIIRLQELANTEDPSSGSGQSILDHLLSSGGSGSAAHIQQQQAETRKAVAKELDQRMTTFKQTFVPRNELEVMLHVGSATDPNRDANHVKLQHMIEKSLGEHLQVIDRLRLESEERLFHELAEQRTKIVKSFEQVDETWQKKLNEQQHQMMTGNMSAGKREAEWKMSQAMQEEIAIMQAKIQRFEQERKESLIMQQQLDEQRKVEHEQLRVLQRRIASIPMDRLLDELKLVKREVEERPSNDQVKTMMKKIESTFKG
jgi:uncharacterized small protein (DUF1192 family)